MILVGQFDSPFVRRVAITMNHYGLPFERKILSVFTDFEKMLTVNPLGKVPALQLDDGEYIFDSRMIIDYLDRLFPEEIRLIPSNPEYRIQVLRTEAIALGLAEKCYERGCRMALSTRLAAHMSFAPSSATRSGTPSPSQSWQASRTALRSMSRLMSARISL